VMGHHALATGIAAHGCVLCSARVMSRRIASDREGRSGCRRRHSSIARSCDWLSQTGFVGPRARSAFITYTAPSALGAHRRSSCRGIRRWSRRR
jgi:hypothetical protein